MFQIGVAIPELITFFTRKGAGKRDHNNLWRFKCFSSLFDDQIKVINVYLFFAIEFPFKEIDSNENLFKSA